MGISFDPISEHILITSPTVEVSALEIYNATMDWCDDQETMNYTVPMGAVGKFGMGGGAYSDSVFILLNGWKIKFWSGTYQAKIVGTLITDDETDIITPPDSGSVTVVTQASSQGIVFEPETATDIADEVWTHTTGTQVSSDLDNPDQYKADVSSLALESSIQTVQSDLDDPSQYQADLTDVTSLVEVVEKMLTNRLKIDEVANTMTIYEDNGTTPLVVFNLKNKEGSPAHENVYERIPQ